MAEFLPDFRRFKADREFSELDRSWSGRDVYVESLSMPLKGEAQGGSEGCSHIQKTFELFSDRVEIGASRRSNQSFSRWLCTDKQ